jgi:hypothetical protein
MIIFLQKKVDLSSGYAYVNVIAQLQYRRKRVHVLQPRCMHFLLTYRGAVLRVMRYTFLYLPR